MALQLDDFLITGRTFEEYSAFFDLDIEELEHKRVLDCPSGVSSFVATANRQGIAAEGCDMIYRFARADIVHQGELSIDKIYADTTWMQGHNLAFYGSIEGHRSFREQALAGFKGDHNLQRYRYETLPSLSYADDSFDLLLSSHLLFVYDDRLDLDFHIKTITEMLRVAREVRIFPLIDFMNSRRDETENLSPFVKAVMAHFNAEIIAVDFEFQPGGNAMMRLCR